MTDITLKPMPSRPRPGDDRLTRRELRTIYALACLATIPAIMAIGFIMMGLVCVGEQFLPSPQAMIEVIP